MQRRVFLSYGHDGHASLALRLKSDLEARGIPVWFDLDRLRPGADWECYIEQGLEWASEVPGEGRFVLLMTPHSVRRPDGYCLNELARAIEQELPVIPVMVSWCSPPLSIARLQWLDMSRADDAAYAIAFERLTEVILVDEPESEAGQSRLLRHLEPLSFHAEFHKHLAGFTGREWIEVDLDAWLEDSSADRIFWITAPPGAGKSALAVWLASRRPELAGIHFCRAGRSRKGDARHAVTSLAYQLGARIPDYRSRLEGLALERILSETDAGTLFDELISQPLTGLPQPDARPLVLLVDALDEATHDGQNEMAQLLASEFPRTPEWLRLLITSRPDEPSVALHLQGHEPYELARHEGFARDIEEYLRDALASHVADTRLEETIGRILTRSEDSFLYARWVCQELAAGRLDPNDPQAFPDGLGGIYLQFFQRKFPDPRDYAGRQRPVLEVLCAAREPVPLAELTQMMEWSPYESQEIPESFGALLHVRDARVHAFHLSALDWIRDRTRAGPYTVLPSEGQRRLAAYTWKQYTSDAGAMPPYCLAHAVGHLLEAGRVDDARTILLDFAVLRRRTADDLPNLLEDIGQAAAASADEVHAQLLDTLRSALSLASSILLREPHQLASQLQARLLTRHEPELAALVERAMGTAAVPVLRACTPALRQAGDPLTRVLRGAATGDDDPDLFALEAVALDDARNVAMAISESGIFHLWNLYTGLLERRDSLEDLVGASCGALDPVRRRWMVGAGISKGAVVVVDLGRAGAPVVTRLCEGDVEDVALAPGGALLCTAHGTGGGRGGLLRLWRADDLTEVCTIKVPGGVPDAVAFSGDGATLFWAAGKKVCCGPASAPGTVHAVIPIDARVSTLSVAPGGELLAVGRDDGVIELVSPNAPDARTRLAGHPSSMGGGHVSGLHFQGDGHTLVSTGWDGSLRAWCCETGDEIADCPTDSKVFGLAVGGRGRWAVTGHKSGGARLWDLQRLSSVPRVERFARSFVGIAALDGAGVVVTGGTGQDGARLRAWRIDDGALIGDTPVDGSLLALGLDGDPAAPRLRTVSEAGVRTWIVEPESGQPALRPEGRSRALSPKLEWSWEVALTAGGIVATHSVRTRSRLLSWPVTGGKGKEISALNRHGVRPGLSADGGVCVALSRGARPLHVYDSGSLREREFPAGAAADGRYCVLAVAPDAGQVAVGNERGAVTLIELGCGTCRELRDANGDWVSTLAFSTDSAWLVLGTIGGRLEVWDTAAGSLTALFCSNDGWSCAWAGAGAEHVIAGDYLGRTHFLHWRR